MIEVSLTVVLLAGAGLLLNSYQRMRGTDIGIPIENTLTMHLNLPDARYGEPEKQAYLFRTALITRVRALPGVDSAGLDQRRTRPRGGAATASLILSSARFARKTSSTCTHALRIGYFAAAQDSAHARQVLHIR